MTRKYCYILFLALCLTGGILKLRVTWQPSLLPIKPTAMSWIIDSTGNRRDFMPSEEGFIEFRKKRVKRNSENGDNSGMSSDVSGDFAFYNFETLTNSNISRHLVSQIVEKEYGSGSGTSELSGDYSGSGEERLVLGFPHTVSYQSLHDFKENSGSGDISIPEEVSASENGSGVILTDLNYTSEDKLTSFVDTSENTASTDISVTISEDTSSEIYVNTIERTSSADASVTITADSSENLLSTDASITVTAGTSSESISPTDASITGAAGTSSESISSTDASITITADTSSERISYVDTVEISSTDASSADTSKIYTGTSEWISSTDTVDNSFVDTSDITSFTDISEIKIGLTTTSFYSESSSILESTSSPTAKVKSTNQKEITGTSKTFTVRSDFQEGRTFSGNVTTEVARLPCFSSNQCDSERNQRCVEEGDVFVCGCGRSFLLNPEIQKCEVKISLVGRLRCPNESYHPELNQHGSLQYHQMEKQATEALSLVFESCNCVNFPGAYLKVTHLQPGSLLIDWELTFPDSRHGIIQNQFIESLHENIDFILKTQQSALNKSPIDLRDTEVVYINAVNPCSDPERNYCSFNAHCLVSNNTAGGYICKCNEGYQDISPDPKFHPGEVCQEICIKEYCGRNGECVVKSNKAICRCDNWYSGKTCRVSVLVLAASIGCMFILVLAIAITFGRYYYNKRKGTSGIFRLKANSISKSKKHEEIALATTKYLEVI